MSVSCSRAREFCPLGKVGVPFLHIAFIGCCFFQIGLFVKGNLVGTGLFIGDAFFLQSVQEYSLFTGRQRNKVLGQLGVLVINGRHGLFHVGLHLHDFLLLFGTIEGKFGSNSIKRQVPGFVHQFPVFGLFFRKGVHALLGI